MHDKWWNKKIKWLNNESIGISRERALVNFIIIVVVTIILSNITEYYLGINSQRAAIFFISLFLFIASFGRPQWLFLTFRNLSVFSAFRDDVAAGIVLVIMSIIGFSVAVFMPFP